MGRLNDIIEIATQEVRDFVGYFDDTQLKQVAKIALRYEFSEAKPLEQVEDIPGNNTRLYNITPVPDTAGTWFNWEQGFSKILLIQYPINEVQPNPLRGDAYYVEKMTDTVSSQKYRLRFQDWSPNVTQTFRVYYTYRHTIDISNADRKDSTTIFPGDEAAAGYLVAKEMLEKLSNQFSIMANIDTKNLKVDFKNLSKQAAQRAADTYAKYKREFQKDLAPVNAHLTHMTIFYDHNANSL